jgi:hypothetical protein
MRSSTAVIISLSFLVGARHGHNHAEAYGHEAQRRVLTTDVIVVTETIYQTVTIEPSIELSSTLPCSTSAVPSGPPSHSLTNGTKLPEKGASPAAAPSTSPLKKTDGNPYQLLVPEPNTASLKNSCGYDVYVSSVGDNGCGPNTNCKLVPANTTYTESIRVCYKSGISLKVAKTDAMIQPMQFEYTVWDDKKTVSYDISYLDCMNNKNGEKDLSACAGHDGGIQAVAGADCPAYHCLAGEWCSVHAYVVPEFGYQDGAPVGACTVEKGVAFELCAGNR